MISVPRPAQRRRAIATCDLRPHRRRLAEATAFGAILLSLVAGAAPAMAARAQPVASRPALAAFVNGLSADLLLSDPAGRSVVRVDVTTGRRRHLDGLFDRSSAVLVSGNLLATASSEAEEDSNRNLLPSTNVTVTRLGGASVGVVSVGHDGADQMTWGPPLGRSGVIAAVETTWTPDPSTPFCGDGGPCGEWLPLSRTVHLLAAPGAPRRQIVSGDVALLDASRAGILVSTSSGLLLYPLDGGAPRPITAAEPGAPTAAQVDGRRLIVRRSDAYGSATALYDGGVLIWSGLAGDGRLFATRRQLVWAAGRKIWARPLTAPSRAYAVATCRRGATVLAAAATGVIFTCQRPAKTWFMTTAVIGLAMRT